MHIRPGERGLEATPGPSDYSIDRGLGGTSPTFHIRPEEHISGGGPGPGAYDPSNPTITSPAFSIKGRHESAEKPNTAPYQMLPSTVGEGPKYSLHSRPADRDAVQSPGPNYIHSPHGTDAAKYSMTSQHDAKPLGETPGPGQYTVGSSIVDAPKFTLHGRTPKAIGGTASPGPTAYSPDSFKWGDQGGRRILERFTEHSLEVSPGPSDYVINRGLGGTSPTLHDRPEEHTVAGGPGPGAYSPTITSPAFSIKDRPESTELLNTAPYQILPSTVGEGLKFSLHSRRLIETLSSHPDLPASLPPLERTSRSLR
jgi:hypothetical protein